MDMHSFHDARGLQPDDGLTPPYGGVLVQAFLDTAGRAALTERLPRLAQVPVSLEEKLDLEMIASGAYSPLTGFMTRAVYTSVLAQASLPDGRPWGLPVTLAAACELARTLRCGEDVALMYNGAVVGVMRIDEIFPWDASAEARALDAGAGDPRTAVRRAAHRFACLLGGPVAMLAAREAGFMLPGHHWPLELRHHIVSRGWRQVAVPHVRRPWLRTHEYLLKCTLEASDGLLLHTSAGSDCAPPGLPATVLAAASRQLIENYFPVQRILENPLPPWLLGPHPRAILNHAIVSQNYGVDMLSVPAREGADAARDLLAAAAARGLGIRVVSMPAAFHCEACGGIATGKSCPHDDDRRLALNEDGVIEDLCLGEVLSPLAARPDIARALARAMAERLDTPATGAARHIHPHAAEVSRELRQALTGHRACALWMTGLSGSGKSTIAHRLERELLLSGHRVFVVDGDTLRHGLNRDLGFSEGDRRENLRRAAELVKVMVEAGMIVIASFISPFRAERQMVRALLGPAFQEVYVEASLSACEERDPKGLYRRARAGQIAQFTGISSPYEVPEHPEITLNTTVYSVEQCVRQLHEHLSQHALLRTAAVESHRAPDAPLPGPMRIQ